MHDGNPDDFQWDVVTGISGGAINTGAMSVWAKEDGLAMSEWLSDMWQNHLHTHDVWKWWPCGVVCGITEKQALVDSTPLLEFLSSVLGEFKDGVLRYSMVGTVNANNAEYHRFHLDAIPKDQILE